MKSAGISIIVAAAVVVGLIFYGIFKPRPMRVPTAAQVKTEVDALKAEAAKNIRAWRKAMR